MPRKSIVWNFFDKSSDDKFATCVLCKRQLKYFVSRPTTNLNTHLKRKHPILYSEKLNEEQNLVMEDDEPAQISESMAKEFNLALLNMVLIDYQPFSFVENTGFVEFINAINPLYQIPSKHFLSKNLLPALYNDKVQDIKQQLKLVDYVSLTTDIWQSDNNNSYISVICHFISQKKLNSVALATREFSKDNHTGKNIANVLSSVMKDWDIENKVVTFVSDNGSNIRNAIIEHLNNDHYPCVAYTLNLCVKDALNRNQAFKCLISKCKDLVSHFKHSSVAMFQLKKVQKEMGKPEIKVKQSVETRWNSILPMLERLLEIKDPLSVAITNIPDIVESLDTTEWDTIADCVPVLKCLELLTAELSGEKYVSMSTMIPLVWGFQNCLRKLSLQTNVGLQLQRSLLDIIGKRYASLELNQITAKSTFLDPRFKKIGFSSEDNAKTTQKWILDELKTMILGENRLEENQVADFVPEISEKHEETSFGSHFDEELTEVETKPSPMTTAILSLRQYVELPYYNRMKDPLEFWENHKYMLPELYKLHLKYLCVPATSVLSERVFSKAGQIKNERRNCLSPKYLDKIIFLNSIL